MDEKGRKYITVIYLYVDDVDWKMDSLSQHKRENSKEGTYVRKMIKLEKSSDASLGSKQIQ